jgi:hypothetical protein
MSTAEKYLKPEVIRQITRLDLRARLPPVWRSKPRMRKLASDCTVTPYKCMV